MTLTIGQAAQAALVIRSWLTVVASSKIPITRVSIESARHGSPVVWLTADTEAAAECIADALNLTNTSVRRTPHEDDHLWWARSGSTRCG